jgi:hypothetical protein
MISLSNSTGGIGYSHISGLNVITTNIFHFWITASNIGSYFYFNPPVTASLTNTAANGTFLFNPASTPFYSDTAGTTYTTVPIRSPTYFLWSGVTVTNPSAPGSENTYTLSGTTSNLIGNASLILDTSSNGKFKPYYDPASVTAMSYNTRVTSGSGFSPGAGTFGDTFDNSINIANGAYTSELQLYNGGYVTKQIPGSYANYTTYTQIVGSVVTNPDYSGVNTGTAIRWVTFKFASITTTNILNKVDTITFDYLYISGQPSASGTSPLGFYVSVSNIARFNSSSQLNTNDSSAWLNLNKHAATAPTIINKNTELTAGSANNTFTRSGTTDTFVVKVPDGCGYNNFDMYIRVGFSMGNSHSLQRVNNPSKTEIVVPLLFSFTELGTFPKYMRLNVIQGLPSNTYNILSNFLYLGASLLRTNTHTMQPTLNSYAGPSTGTDHGTQFSNLSVIYKPDGTKIWESNYGVFTVTPPTTTVTINSASATPNTTNGSVDIVATKTDANSTGVAHWTINTVNYAFGSNTLNVNISAPSANSLVNFNKSFDISVSVSNQYNAGTTTSATVNRTSAVFTLPAPTIPATISYNYTPGNQFVSISQVITQNVNYPSGVTTNWSITGGAASATSGTGLTVSANLTAAQTTYTINVWNSLTGINNSTSNSGTLTTPQFSVPPALTDFIVLDYARDGPQPYYDVYRSSGTIIGNPTPTRYYWTWGGSAAGSGSNFLQPNSGLFQFNRIRPSPNETLSYNTTNTITIYASNIAGRSENYLNSGSTGNPQIYAPAVTITFGYTLGDSSFTATADYTLSGTATGATVAFAWNNGGAGGTTRSLSDKTNFGVSYGVTVTYSRTGYLDNTAGATNTAPSRAKLDKPSIGTLSDNYAAGNANFTMSAAITAGANATSGTIHWTWSGPGTNGQTTGLTGTGSTASLANQTSFGQSYTLAAESRQTNCITSDPDSKSKDGPNRAQLTAPSVTITFTYTGGTTFIANAVVTRSGNATDATIAYAWSRAGTGTGETTQQLTGQTSFGVLYGVIITISKTNYQNNTANTTNTAPVQIFTGTVSGTEYARIYTIDVRRSPDGRTGAIISGTPTITLVDSGGYLSYNYPNSSSIEVTMNDTLDPTPYFTYSVNWTT